MTRPVPRRFGFALVELMVAVAVLAVMAAATVPALGVWLDREPRPAEEVAALLRSARTEALSSARPVAVTLDPATGRWISEREGRPPKYGTLRLREASLETDADRLVFQFGPAGASAGGAVAILAGGRLMVVRIDRWTGEVSIRAT